MKVPADFLSASLASMELIFRTATLSEGKEVVRVIRAAFTPYMRALGREFPADGSAAFAERWQRIVAELGRGDVYLALAGHGEGNGEGNGEGAHIVGAVRTTPQENDLYINQIAVDPSQQGSGIGSWLLQRIDEVARARGLGGLTLETAEMAVANIRLYQRHGFAIVRRGPPDHGLDAHPRVYMAKTFRAAAS
ncbi:MAG: GNAT family N-acetyltransferase [Proteobacteria bacterium]|nr:GNAT family N-acetyltransferase [Pseudomonadota bacterium]